MDQFARTALLIGEEALDRLKNSRVAVFGLGGVGGYVVEALARSGVGALDLIDHDRVSLTNLNRQILATHETVGRLKVEVAKERVASICPDILVREYPCFFLPETETACEFDFSAYDYVVDAIDTVAGKIGIVLEAKKHGIPVISCMGTGNKLDPGQLRISDLAKTTTCPLARVMRRELKARGITHLKVLWSAEAPVRLAPDQLEQCLAEEGVSHRTVPGSTAFVPPVAGLMIAAEVVKDLIADSRQGAKQEGGQENGQASGTL